LASVWFLNEECIPIGKKYHKTWNDLKKITHLLTSPFGKFFSIFVISKKKWNNNFLKQFQAMSIKNSKPG